DRRSGAMLWQRPATVQRQALVQGMPPDLPFIAFAGSLDSRGGAAREGITALLLDKATGRTLYADDSLPQSGVGYCVATLNDAAQKQVLLDVAGKVMTVTYTAERRPPEPPAMAEVESPPTGASGGILGIFRTMGGAP
ncbi:MAG TPA: hypothetical protein VEQ85_03390, partial [Lacipirellulaceae bacterium]|nr:hypothetical protein [Lacipirellulaceae bacterium]